MIVFWSLATGLASPLFSLSSLLVIHLILCQLSLDNTPHRMGGVGLRSRSGQASVVQTGQSKLLFIVKPRTVSQHEDSAEVMYAWRRTRVFLYVHTQTDLKLKHLHSQTYATWTLLVLGRGFVMQSSQWRLPFHLQESSRMLCLMLYSRCLKLDFMTYLKI